LTQPTIGTKRGHTLDMHVRTDAIEL